MRLFKIDVDDFEEVLEGKCVSCRWSTTYVYVLAANVDEANGLIHRREAGLCGDCVGDLLSELEYDISRSSIFFGNEQLTACARYVVVIEKGDKYYIGYCPEVPGANGQGETLDERRESLKEAIKLILQDRLEDGLA